MLFKKRTTLTNNLIRCCHHMLKIVHQFYFSTMEKGLAQWGVKGENYNDCQVKWKIEIWKKGCEKEKIKNLNIEKGIKDGFEILMSSIK